MYKKYLCNFNNVVNNTTACNIPKSALSTISLPEKVFDIINTNYPSTYNREHGLVSTSLPHNLLASHNGHGEEYGCCEFLKTSDSSNLYVVIPTYNSPSVVTTSLARSGDGLNRAIRLFPVTNYHVKKWIEILHNEYNLNVSCVINTKERKSVLSSFPDKCDFLKNNQIIVKIDYSDRKYDHSGFRCLVALQAVRIAGYSRHYRNDKKGGALISKYTLGKLPAYKVFNVLKNKISKFTLLSLLFSKSVNFASNGWFSLSVHKSDEEIDNIICGNRLINNTGIGSIMSLFSSPLNIKTSQVDFNKSLAAATGQIGLYDLDKLRILFLNNPKLYLEYLKLYDTLNRSTSREEAEEINYKIIKLFNDYVKNNKKTLTQKH